MRLIQSDISLRKETCIVKFVKIRENMTYMAKKSKTREMISCKNKRKYDLHSKKV